MKLFICFCMVVNIVNVMSEIDSNASLLNKLKQVNARPVGRQVARKFMPLTEISPPMQEMHVHSDGRRHLPADCTPVAPIREVDENPPIHIDGDYYDERVAKTVATVIIPDHIDHKHFEITTQVPYLTVGPIEALGYHPSTIKSAYPSECERIYQDHMAEQYSDESVDFSEESMEMARMPIFKDNRPSPLDQKNIDQMYSD